MKIENLTILSLNEDEIGALKKLLGNLSGKKHKEYGLDENQSRIMTSMWLALPTKDED